MKKTSKKPVKKSAQSGVLKTVKKTAKALTKKAVKAVAKKAAPKKAAPKKVVAKKKFTRAPQSERKLTPVEETPVLLNALGVKGQIAVDNSGSDVAHQYGHRKLNLKDAAETKTSKRMLAENSRAKNKPQIVNHAVRSSAKRG